MVEFAKPSIAAQMSGLFAPAYTVTNPQPAQDWQNRVFNVNDVNIEQTRKPVSFNTGNPAGMLDPEALRVRTQGGPYDFGPRRDAIAAQVVAQQQAAAQQAAAQQAAAQPQTGTGGLVAYGTPEYAALEQRWAAELAANGPRVQQPVYQDSFGGGPA